MQILHTNVYSTCVIRSRYEKFPKLTVSAVFEVDREGEGEAFEQVRTRCVCECSCCSCCLVLSCIAS